MSNRTAAPEVFHLYDTTLRDGAQQEDMRLSVAGKLRIASLLDDLGVTFIEGGRPGVDPIDTAFFQAARSRLELANAQLVAHGNTRRGPGRAADDPLVAALRDAGTRYVCVVAQSHDRLVEQALQTTLSGNLDMITDTVTHLVGEGKRVFVNCQHFFDGYAMNPDYALEVVRTAAEAGAEVVVLCDSNGGMLPTWMADVVSAAGAVGVDLGVHCHNDTGCAVGNSMAAIEAGVMHVQGTVNGYGERSGTADLTTIIANLQLKFGWHLLDGDRLSELTHISHAIADLTNQVHQPRQPYVGASSFAHRTGRNTASTKVNEDLFPHTRPEVVGNHMRMVISDLAGRATIATKAAQLGYDLSDRQLLARVAQAVRQRESVGYSYEASDASLELLLRDCLGTLRWPFRVHSWKVVTDHETVTDLTRSEATVRLEAGGREHTVRGEGNGPVNALDQALKSALTPFFAQVTDFRLADYRVRILESGTAGAVRAQVDMTDGRNSWTCVGVGTNVIEASYEALADGYLFGLIGDDEGARIPQLSSAMLGG